MTDPTVSVIVPTYNAGAYVPGCVENILAQNVEGIEIIFVDDGSEDDTREIVASFDGVKYVAQDNRGPSAARNLGLTLARGTYLAFLDVDDRWPLGTVENLLQHFTPTGRPQVVLGRVQCMIRPPKAPESIETFISFGAPFVAFSLGAALFSPDVFRLVGNFDESLREGEDVDWFLRAREAGINPTIIGQTTLFYRRREGSITYGRQHDASTLAKMLKRSLDRRRQARGGVDDENVVARQPLKNTDSS